VDCFLNLLKVGKVSKPLVDRKLWETVNGLVVDGGEAL